MQPQSTPLPPTPQVVPQTPPFFQHLNPHRHPYNSLLNRNMSLPISYSSFYQLHNLKKGSYHNNFSLLPNQNAYQFLIQHSIFIKSSLMLD
ncbi:unnamed protein product [Hymenolepis diminuta]|uniref:Uncharacterized protein n=1 Tax=Hymenolepis diminuta TaxID=6216 RepID=A0A564Z1L0_HYMDI|nr:unnamed protein product [Hymenolepis diminuta]